MANSSSSRKTEQTAPVAPKRPGPDVPPETLAQRLARARSANEITSVIGLKPIKGRSGPKIAY